MLFTTQRNPPDFEQLSLDGTVITPSTSVKYLGVTMDNKLRFETHIADKISSAKQRLYLVKQFKFLGASNQFLNQIFSSFVESCFFYCLLVIFTNLYDRDIKSIRKVYKTASSYGLENCGFDCIVKERMNTFISHIQKDEHHPFHSFLTKLRSGRLQSYKHRAAIGSDSFIRHFINVVNNSSKR